MNLENNNFSKKIEISTQTNIFCSGAFVVDGGRAVLPYRGQAGIEPVLTHKHFGYVKSLLYSN